MIEIRHQPKYLQVATLLIILIGFSILMISIGDRIGLVIQQIFVYTFVMFLVFGLVRSISKYPIVFTGSQLIYKKGFIKQVADYATIRSISIKAITEKKWKLEVFNDNKKIVEVYLFADNQGLKGGLMTFKNALVELGAPVK